MSRRPFTVPEANARLPGVREVLRRIRGLREEIKDRTRKLQVLDALWDGALLDPSNPDHEEFLEHRKAIRSLLASVEETIRRELLDQGIRFPVGGVEHGLVDFPTTWEGRWVYLCWREGESELRAWHEVDGGFAGRRPLTAEHVRRMGREDDPSDLDDSVLDF